MVKQQTVTIHSLVDGEYQAQRFQREEVIISPTFPQFALTTQQVVAMTES
jgi:Uma2 family endonuclease